MTESSSFFKKSGLILASICILALLIRLSFFFALEPWQESAVQGKVLVGDANGYHALALDIIATHSFSDFGAHRTPLYPLFLVFIYLITGVNPWIVLLIQIFLDVGIVIITHLIAREVFSSEAIGLAAAFLYSISFISAYYSVTLLTEISFTFVFTLSILVFIVCLRKNSIWWYALTGLLIGMATLIRPIAAYIPFMLIVVLLLVKNSIAGKMRNILSLLIVFFIVISPWQLRNLKTYGYYALSTASGAISCWNVATVKAHEEKISVPEAEEELMGDSLKSITNPFEISAAHTKIAANYILKHPLQYAKYSLKGVVRMSLGTARSGISDLLGIKTKRPGITEPILSTAGRIINNISYELPFIILVIKQIIEYLFFAAGLVLLFVKDKKISAFLLVLIISYFVILTGPIGYSRFRIPIVPFYLIISARGIVYAISRRA